jgi:hypothetical protein
MFGVRLAVLGTVCAAILIGALLAIIPVSAQAASNGDLCLYGNDVSSDTGDQMAAGTSPAIAQLSGGGAEIALQDAESRLATYDDATRTEQETNYGLDSGTSPAIATSGTGVFVAMDANGDDELYTGNGTTMAGTGQTMEAGTNPAVTALSSTSADYGYVNPGIDLVEGSGSTWTGQDFGMEKGTSPSLADVSGAWEAANQANTSSMWTATAKSHTNTKLGMDITTSPTIAALGKSGDLELAMQSNQNQLWTWGDATEGNTHQAMAANTSPSIAPIGSGTGYEVAYQGSDGDLWLYGSSGSLDTGHAMAPLTSPSITATKSGYEVAYQCAAPAPPVTTTAVTTTTVVQTTTVEQTTTVQATTPPPTKPTKSRTKKLQAQFALDLTWNGTTSHLVKLRALKRLPADVRVTVACHAETRGDPCPRLAGLAKRKRTLDNELAVVAGRTFTKNNVLTITVSARRYLTEVFTIRLTGQRPSITRRWK